MRRLPIALMFIVFACGDDKTPADVLDTAEEIFQPDTTPDGDGTVGDTTTGNHAPELERIGDRSVAVGQTLSITLSAKDADDDKLTYSVFGNLPEGARFDKAEHRFEWAPTEANKTVFLTFVVSDGTDFDRETVRIQVTATATTNPPSFTEIGDQALTVDADYQLQLVATDPDGDRLTFGHEGTLPSGAELDAATGKFTWRPGADSVGAPVRITFTVSDGTSSDSLAVRFVVDDGNAPARPPEMKDIAPQTVKVGATLTLTLEATDPDGDSITFIMQHEPPGATLSGATFTFTPTQDLAGKTFQVSFAASDGTFSDIVGVQISVTSGGQTTQCPTGGDEPNEELDTATVLPAGTHAGTICETETQTDIDTYAITLAANQELTATMTFDAGAGDLDLLLLDGDANELGLSDGVTSTEEIRYASPTATTVYLVVFGYALEPASQSYSLVTAVGAAHVCADDSAYEDNDQPFDAKPLDDSAQGATHQICANDVDYWTIGVMCGAEVEVIMDISGGVDLDMYLYDTATGDGAPVASAFTEDPSEYIDVLQVERPGTWLLKIEGYPETTEGAYQVIASSTGSCDDDSVAGTTKDNAKALASDGAGFADLKLCCRDDWFKYSLAPGDQVVVDLSVFGGAAGLVVYGANGTTQVASKDPSPNGGLLFFSADAGGTYYLKASGAVGTSYGLAWTVSSGGDTCNTLSCGTYSVCDAAANECVSDFCVDDGECPGGYVCRETYCVNTCAGNGDCRTGYACKGFDDASGVVQYCGIDGDGVPGDSCQDHAACLGNEACLFDEHDGYCATLGCGSCGTGTKCATVGGSSFCAKSCATNADCREADGFTCSAEKTCLPQNP